MRYLFFCMKERRFVNKTCEYTDIIYIYIYLYKKGLHVPMGFDSLILNLVGLLTIVLTLSKRMKKFIKKHKWTLSIWISVIILLEVYFCMNHQLLAISFITFGLGFGIPSLIPQILSVKGQLTRRLPHGHYYAQLL